MKVGFTGTRKGMTILQKKKLLAFLTKFGNVIKEVHHGDCVGADAEFHEIVRQNFPTIKIVIHPPINPKFRAFCDGDEERKPKDYLARNRDIVDETDILIACPAQKKEILRSGTWATVRYARKKKKFILIIFPDGSLEVENY